MGRLLQLLVLLIFIHTKCKSSKEAMLSVLLCKEKVKLNCEADNPIITCHKLFLAFIISVTLTSLNCNTLC